MAKIQKKYLDNKFNTIKPRFIMFFSKKYAKKATPMRSGFLKLNIRVMRNVENYFAILMTSSAIRLAESV